MQRKRQARCSSSRARRLFERTGSALAALVAECAHAPVAHFMRSVETGLSMSFARYRLAGVCAALLTGLPAVASHLVTGNGFGFAVVSPETGTATRFYAHPYSFLRPDPA